MDETRDIPGFNGLFAITKDGRVFKRPTRTANGHSRKGFELKQRLNPAGYPTVYLLQETHYVHRLVLRSWVREPKQGEETRHLNDIKTDNRLANLRWGSRKENAEDMVRNGRSASSRTHCSAGHLYTEENTYTKWDGDYPHRVCKTCRREWDKERYWRNREVRKNSRSKH